jgi:cysteine-rich repeat protein
LLVSRQLECIRSTSLCRACLLLDEADDTGASCDLVDNGAQDASCGCGNGVLDRGEACDDGNFIDGDCCSSSCTVEPTSQTCADDRNACTADHCDGAGACVHPSLPVCDGVSLHEYVAAVNLVVVYPRSFVPNAPGGFDAQDPRDKRSIETVVRVDPTIDFYFGGELGPPGTFFYPYMYSVRWTGGLEAPVDGTYGFDVTSGGYAAGRLYIDGTLIAEKSSFERNSGRDDHPVDRGPSRVSLRPRRLFLRRTRAGALAATGRARADDAAVGEPLSRRQRGDERRPHRDVLRDAIVHGQAGAAPEVLP